MEVNRAPLELLLRVPGIGARSAYKITSARRYSALAFEDLKKMRVVLKRAKHFITCKGKFYGEQKQERVKHLLAGAEARENAEQLTLFSSHETALSALTGEL